MTATQLRSGSGWKRRMGIAAASGGVVALIGGLVWTILRPAWHWRRATAAFAEARWERAEAELAELAWYRPDDPAARRLRIAVALRRQDLEAAVRLLAEVPETAPEAPAARLQRGRLLLELFRVREAEEAFRDGLRLDPAMVEAHRWLLAILGVERRARDFEAQLWALHNQGGRALEALRLLAEAAPVIPPGTLKKTADEGVVLERCLAADPQAPHVRAALAHFYRGRGRIDDARRLLEPWLRDHPGDPEATLEWIACLLDEGETRSAGSWLEKGPSEVRSHGGYWTLRGEWCRRLGRDAEALACFQEAVRRDPRDPEARYRLGRALQAAGRTVEAAEVMEVARKAHELKGLVAGIALEAPDPALLARASRLCREMGRDREANAWEALVSRVRPGGSALPTRSAGSPSPSPRPSLPARGPG